MPISLDLFSTDWPTPRDWRQELVEVPTGGSCTGDPGLDLEGGALLETNGGVTQPTSQQANQQIYFTLKRFIVV